MGRELWFGAIAALMLTANAVIAAELWIGAAEADITPDRPVALDGNTTGPISQGVRSRIRAEVLALEAREQGKPTDAAILIVCDLVRIRPGVQAAFRTHVAAHLPGFDTRECGGYLATRDAEKAGGYSALVESCPVGHEGGQIFVERTVGAIRKVFAKE